MKKLSSKINKELVKKEIRKDLKNYDGDKIGKISEESSSTKKMWKELGKERNLMIEMKDQKGVAQSNRELIMQIAKQF